MGAETLDDDGLTEHRPYLVGVAWGLLWRYTVVGAVALAVVGGPHIPIAAVVAIGAGGVVLGLWFRHWWTAALWRAAMLGWVTATTAGSIVFPLVVVAALAVVTVEPWLTVRSRRRSRDRRRRAAPTTSLPRPAAGQPPAADWPRAKRRR
jgi:hypothetical protein